MQASQLREQRLATATSMSSLLKQCQCSAMAALDLKAKDGITAVCCMTQLGSRLRD